MIHAKPVDSMIHAKTARTKATHPPLPSTSLSDLASPSGNLYKTVLASGLLYKMEALWDMDQDQDGGPKGRLVQMASCVSASCHQRIRNPQVLVQT